MNIELSKRFKKEFKRLNKKYRLTNDFAELVKSLKADPNQGVPLGRGAFKIRMSISAKNKGKSSGARVITLVFIEDEKIFLLDIFDKSEKENISDHELDELINSIEE